MQTHKWLQYICQLIIGINISDYIRCIKRNAAIPFNNTEKAIKSVFKREITLKTARRYKELVPGKQICRSCRHEISKRCDAEEEDIETDADIENESDADIETGLLSWYQ